MVEKPALLSCDPGTVVSRSSGRPNQLPRSDRSRATSRGLGAAWRQASIVAAVALSLTSLKYFAFPYVWIGLVWSAVLFSGTFVFRRDALRIISFNVACACLALTILEAYLWMAPALQTQHVHTYSEGYRRTDDILGGAPQKGFTARSTRRIGEKLLYDVTYSIDSDGLRKAPPDRGDGIEGCVLFFGGSFTFGEGVNDDEAMPYVVGVETDGKYRTYNFGFHGYGPHHMLSALQHNLVDRIVDCDPTHVIYQALPHHVARAAGLVPFHKHAPRYRLAPNGRVVFHGHFDDEEAVHHGEVSYVLKDLWRLTATQFSKSSIYKKISDRYRKPNDRDVELYLQIVHAAREFTRTQYPRSEFHILLWEDLLEGQHLFEKVHEGLKKMDMRIHGVPEILSGYRNDSTMYALAPEDRHPNPLAHRLIAEHVAAAILGKWSVAR